MRHGPRTQQRYRALWLALALPACASARVTGDRQWLDAIARRAPPAAANVSDCAGVEALALVRHPAVLTARAGLPAAQAAVAVAAVPANPDIRVGGEYGSAASTSDRNISVLQFALPNPMLLSSAVAAAQAQVVATEAVLAQTKWSVRHDVRLAWARLNSAANGRDLAQQWLLLRQERASWAVAAVQAGAIEPMVSQQAALLLIDAKDRMARSEEAIALGEARLAEAAGAPLGVVARDWPELVCPLPQALTQTGDDAEAIASNPALAVWKARYAVADEDAAVEHGKSLPWFKFVQVGTETMVVDGRRSIRVGAAIEVPLFHWLGAANRLAEAQRDRYYNEYVATAAGLAQSRALAVAQWRLSHARATRLHNEVLPAVMAAVDVAQKAVALRRWPASVLYEARERAFETQSQLTETRRLCVEASINAAFYAGPP